MDGATWGAIIAAIVASFGFIVTIWRGSGEIAKTNAAVTTNGEEIEALKKSVTEQERRLTAHQIDVAQNYVSKEALRATESNILAAIQHLGERFDKVLLAVLNKGTA